MFCISVQVRCMSEIVCVCACKWNSALIILYEEDSISVTVP